MAGCTEQASWPSTSAPCDVPATGRVSQLYLLALSLCSQVGPTAEWRPPTLTCLLEGPYPHSSSLLFFTSPVTGSKYFEEGNSAGPSQTSSLSDSFIPFILEGDQTQACGVVLLHHPSAHRSLLLQLLNINSLQISLSRWFIFTNNTQSGIPTEPPPLYLSV